LSSVLAGGALAESAWRAVGAAVAQLHQAGVEHADLNAHNLLLDAHGAVSVIDFDRGRLRAPGIWVNRNLRRLQRSLAKISRGLPAGRYSARDWEWLMAGYRAAAGREAA
jgi:tRNA A-37 threonylcarbamoyl transferase component Bud32